MYRCVIYVHRYNPNEEEGADFYCTSTDFSDAAPDNVKTIGKKSYPERRIYPYKYVDLLSKI